MSTETPSRSASSSSRRSSGEPFRSFVSGLGVSLLVVVLLASGASGVTAAVVPIAGLVVGWLATRLGVSIARRAWVVPIGVGAVAVACVLIGVTPQGAITVVIAALLGSGIGLAVPDQTDVDRRTMAAGVVAGGVLIGLVWLVGGRISALWAAAGIAIAVGGAALVLRLRQGQRAEPGRKLGRAGVSVVVLTALLAVGLVSWVGANDPTVQWFGHVVTHGDRTQRRVALTFDDGPDDPYTMDVSRILDEHGVKGTFFEVGKAVDARPEISRALRDDGQLVGNHSYHHDYWRWLDPRYPELDRTQQAFQRALGVCPAFFRPPHGQRTPFMLAQVHDDGMHAVTWDVSAQDWSERDGELVARNIVDRSQPGSIILLHDGLDGDVHADRSVLLTALPLIIDGLRAKGLEPVTLDRLLDLPGYLDRC